MHLNVAFILDQFAEFGLPELISLFYSENSEFASVLNYPAVIPAFVVARKKHSYPSSVLLNTWRDRRRSKGQMPSPR